MLRCPSSISAVLRTNPACAYDYQPLEAIVAEHFDFFDLTMAEPGGEELAMLVLTQPGQTRQPRRRISTHWSSV